MNDTGVSVRFLLTGLSVKRRNAQLFTNCKHLKLPAITSQRNNEETIVNNRRLSCTQEEF